MALFYKTALHDGGSRAALACMRCVGAVRWRMFLHSCAGAGAGPPCCRLRRAAQLWGLTSSGMPSSVELFFDVDEIVSGLDKAPSILSQQFLPKQKGVEIHNPFTHPPAGDSVWPRWRGSWVKQQRQQRCCLL